MLLFNLLDKMCYFSIALLLKFLIPSKFPLVINTLFIFVLLMEDLLLF